MAFKDKYKEGEKMQDNVIEITNLSLPYAFQKFNLSLERNKLTAITGPNSCGKTTIIKSIIGQIFTDNTIYIFSQELEYYRITELNIIMKCIIPQEYIFTEETVFEEIETSLSNLDMPLTTKHKKMKEIIKELNLTKLQKSNPNILPKPIAISLYPLKSQYIWMANITITRNHVQPPLYIFT